jgi:hypothetical protein
VKTPIRKMSRKRTPAKTDGIPSRRLMEAAMELAEVKNERARIANKEKKLTGTVLSLMVNEGFATATRRTFKAETESGSVVTATYVQGERQVVDQDRLKKKVGASLFNKLCNLVLDQKKLEVAIGDGTVSATDVAAVTETLDSAPYVRVSVK